MSHVLQAIEITVASAAIVAVTGGLIRLAFLVRDTSQAAASLTRTVEQLQDRQLDHEQRIARAEGRWEVQERRRR